MRLPSFNRPFHSFKDFFKEYLLIVLGVATALAANAWITRDQHAQAAAASTASMDAELQVSLENIRGSLKKNQAEIRQLGLLGKLIADDLRHGVPAKTINADIAFHRAQFQAGAYFPDASTSAWDVAVANQSVSWIAPDRLQRYSTAYNDLRNLKAWERSAAILTVDYPKVSDFQTDLSQGREVDPLALLHTIEQLKLALQTADGNIASIEDDLEAALHRRR
ncbi:MAG TPA: hypothetical protein VJL61_12150 [Rhodanobacteraceae bacterium]|nr:hypothetical protein [Rhodanobacteraceae bacterium]